MSDIVGCVAQLCNLVSKPELNGAYVTIDNYNVERDRCTIRTLVPPNPVAKAVSILVKPSSLQFSQTASFASRYPRAPTQAGSHLMTEYPEGTILDFSSAAHTPSLCELMGQKRILSFEESCRVIGAPVSGTGGPTTVFPDTVAMMPPPGNDVMVVFENIHFTKKLVACASVKLVRFKGCRFSGKESLQVFGDSTVVCENCLFENSVMYGVMVANSARLTLLNCTFRDCQIAVRTQEGATAEITHCTFLNNVVALFAEPKTQLVDLLNCSFTGGDSISLTLKEGTHTRVKGCLWQGCKQEAIKVEGPKRSTLRVENSVLRNCQFGVHAVTGKVDVTILNSEFSHTTYHGIHLSTNITGKADIAGCRFSHNRRDIANLCGVHCPVTIDGQVQRIDDIFERLNAIMPDLQELGEQDIRDNGDCRTALKITRAAKKAGTGLVQCENCRKFEPLDVKFRHCSKCLNVCYCTKECQKTHWKNVHKNECGKIVYG